MASLRTANTKDLEFLIRLDKKLHETKEGTFTPNICGAPFKASFDNYADASMNVREIQRVLRTVERGNLVLYPINTAMGLAVGFQVANLDTKEALLTFKERQLPRGYGFRQLSKYFMRAENIRRAESLGISIVNRRSEYDY